MTPQELHTFTQNAAKGTLVVLNLTQVSTDGDEVDTDVSRVIAEYRDGCTTVSDFVGYGYDFPFRDYPEDFDLIASGRLDDGESCTDTYEIVAVIPPLTR